MTASVPRPGQNGLFGRVAGRVTGVVVDSVNPDAILDHVDVDGVLDRVDVNKLLDRVDADAVLNRVDMDALLDRVDMDALLQRVDMNGLLRRVDVDALLERLDVDALLRRVDLDALLATVDVQALVARSGVPEIVAESTSRVAGSALDVGRRQLVGIDLLVGRGLDRLLRRNPTRLSGPARLVETTGAGSSGREQVTGQYGGPLTRAVAAVLDAVFLFVAFTLGYGGLSLLLSALGSSRVATPGGGGWGLAVTLVLLFGYLFGTQAVSGQTLGQAVVGLRVVTADGAPLTVARALGRTLLLPVSLLAFGLGFLLVIVHPDRRGLHDLVAGTSVVYDWGDRPAAISAPLTAFLARSGREGGPA